MQHIMKTYIQPSSTEINVRPIQMLATSSSPGYGDRVGETGQKSIRYGGWDCSEWSNDADVEE